MFFGSGWSSAVAGSSLGRCLSGLARLRSPGCRRSCLDSPRRIRSPAGALPLPCRHARRDGRHIAAATTKQIQLDLAAVESNVVSWEQQHRTVRSLSAAEVGAVLDHADGLAELLKTASRDRPYRTLGLDLLLAPVGNRFEARLQPIGGGAGV